MNRRDFNRCIANAAAALAALPASPLSLAAQAPSEEAGLLEHARHYAVMMKLFVDLAQGSPSQLEAMFPLKERHIGMLAYPGMFPLDFIGPHQIFTGLMRTRIHIVGKDKQPISTGPGVTVTPNATLAECPENLDVLFVPGGLNGTAALMRDRSVLAFLRKQAATARYVTSVCTGSLVLGAAGLLRGRRATTYWAVRDQLALVGATPVVARYVEDGKFITAGGVTAGLDFGLLLASRLATESYAKALQLYFEYDPKPPFNAGSPETAGEPVTGAMRAMYADGIQTLRSAVLQAHIGEK